jgi:acetoin utilization deacetylase AcuC-like enzyme
MVLIVFASHDLSPSTQHTGTAGNAPEIRKRLIYQQLQERKCHHFHAVTQIESNIQLLGSLVHDKSMLRFLETAWMRWEQEWNKPTHQHLMGVFTPPSHNTADGIRTTPPFVAGFAAPRHDSVQLAPDSSSIFTQACYFSMDKETPIHASTHVQLLWDLAVVRDSTQALIQRKQQIVYALITHPGHHAGPSSYGGFCFINQAAIGARLLQQPRGPFKKIAIIDVDYHAGNGTMATFWNDPTIFFASIHADPAFEYPFNAGFATQTGKYNNIMNVPLPGGIKWTQYREELKRVVNAAKRFGVDALVVSLGLDTLNGDIVAWPGSRFQLLIPDYIEMGQILIHEMGLPTLVIQEGGYDLTQVPQAVGNFFQGAEGGGGKQNSKF